MTAPADRVVIIGNPTRIPAYWPGERNHCPACAASNWLIGRSSAECARCHAALPFSVPATLTSEG